MNLLEWLMCAGSSFAKVLPHFDGFFCDKNDLKLPKHALRWHCPNPLASDHSKIPIGDKCELICRDNYRLYRGGN